MMITKTLRLRLKDKHAAALGEQARSVNTVWNFCNELGQRFVRDKQRWLSGFDFHPYTKGAGKALGLHSQTVQGVAEEYVTRRKQHAALAGVEWPTALSGLGAVQERCGEMEAGPALFQGRLLRRMG